MLATRSTRRTASLTPAICHTRELLEHEVVYAGDPGSVAERLIDPWDCFRFDEFLLISHFGDTSRRQSMKAQELFAKQVMPMLNEATKKRGKQASRRTQVLAK